MFRSLGHLQQVIYKKFSVCLIFLSIVYQELSGRMDDFMLDIDVTVFNSQMEEH